MGVLQQQVEIFIQWSSHSHPSGKGCGRSTRKQAPGIFLMGQEASPSIFPQQSSLLKTKGLGFCFFTWKMVFKYFFISKVFQLLLRVINLWAYEVVFHAPFFVLSNITFCGATTLLPCFSVHFVLFFSVDVVLWLFFFFFRFYQQNIVHSY